MAQIITLNWKLRQRVAPGASDREDALFNTSRIVKVEPSPSGPDPDNLDAEIESKVTYNEMGGGYPIIYHCTDTVAEILTLANG